MDRPLIGAGSAGGVGGVTGGSVGGVTGGSGGGVAGGVAGGGAGGVAGGVVGHEPLTCRICLDDDVRSHLIAPCSCKGSQQWVHRACLDKWRSIKEDRAFSRCTECLHAYQLVGTTQDSSCDLCRRRSRFCWLVTRDVGVLVVATQMCVAVFGAIAWAVDGRTHSYAESFGMENHQLAFYYVIGLLCSLSLLGIAFSCGRSGCCCDSPSTQVTASDLWICDPHVCPYYLYGTPTNCAGCDCGACAGADGCAGCCASGGDCCAAGDCCGAACANVGHELLVLLAVMFVAFAIVGVFVYIFVGAVILQSVVAKHIHVLQKYSLAREYVVKDLAPGALEGEVVLNSLQDVESQSLDRGTPAYHSWGEAHTGGSGLELRPWGRAGTRYARLQSSDPAARREAIGRDPERGMLSESTSDDEEPGWEDEPRQQQPEPSAPREEHGDAALLLAPFQRTELARLGLL